MDAYKVGKTDADDATGTGESGIGYYLGHDEERKMQGSAVCRRDSGVETVRLDYLSWKIRRSKV